MISFCSYFSTVTVYIVVTSTSLVHPTFENNAAEPFVFTFCTKIFLPTAYALSIIFCFIVTAFIIQYKGLSESEVSEIGATAVLKGRFPFSRGIFFFDGAVALVSGRFLFFRTSMFMGVLRTSASWRPRLFAFCTKVELGIGDILSSSFPGVIVFVDGGVLIFLSTWWEQLGWGLTELNGTSLLPRSVLLCDEEACILFSAESVVMFGSVAR